MKEKEEKKKENFLNQTEFLDRVWCSMENWGTKSQLKKYFDAICDELQKVLMEEKSVGLPGVGIFSIERGRPRRIRHVRTGEIMYARGGKLVKFSPSTLIKNHFKAGQTAEAEDDEKNS